MGRNSTPNCATSLPPRRDRTARATYPRVTMSSAIPDSRTPGPFGRGLNLDSLAAAAIAGLDAPPPPQVDGYIMETLLGTGGLGRVWKAVRLADQVTVALKIPHRADPSFTERLHVEAQSLRALDHPHILGCFGHGTTPDGLPWLALEYVHGAPLSALIPPRGMCCSFSWTAWHVRWPFVSIRVIRGHASPSPSLRLSRPLACFAGTISWERL